MDSYAGCNRLIAPDRAGPGIQLAHCWAHAGTKNWAVIISLIKICEIDGVDPHIWLTATATAFARSHKQIQINDMFPWNDAAKV